MCKYKIFVLQIDHSLFVTLYTDDAHIVSNSIMERQAS